MHGRGKTKVKGQLIPVQFMKACRGSRSSDYSFLTSVLDEYEARWAPELVRTFWRIESLASARIQTPECAACSLLLYSLCYLSSGRGKKSLQSFIIKLEKARSC